MSRPAPASGAEEADRLLLPVDVFVYGTLQRGQRNHAGFCHGVVRVEAAWLPGRLWDLAAGYPALSVDPERVLAHGTADPLADARRQQQWQERVDAGPVQPDEVGVSEGVVWGEWMRLPDPRAQLPRLDRLEVYRPGRRSLYQRVLVRVHCERHPRVRVAWTYIQTEPRGREIVGGRWPIPDPGAG